MHLERVVIVNETRFRPDEWAMPGWDLRHLEGPLKCSRMVDNIDNFHFGDYTNSDEALINYCIQKKPQAVLLSIQFQWGKNAPPSAATIRKITFELGIPTVMFWFDIFQDYIAGILERYLHAITLNVILGSNASSHKSLPLEGTNYIYAGLTFDERLFSKPEVVRDIPVGFFGSLDRNRPQWLDGLREFGIPIYTAGGILVDGKRSFLSADKVTPIWMPYEEYLGLMLRLKIALNFSSLPTPKYHPMIPSLVQLALSIRGVVPEALWRQAYRLGRSFPGLKYIISLKNPVPSLKNPRYMIRGRVWEALWCRTFLLEEDNPVTSMYFEPYVDYVPFTTLRDLVDKIRYYLKNEEERDRIRMQGRARVEKYCNAQIFWENLFEVIGIQSVTQYDHHPGEFWNKAYFDNWYLSTGTRNTGRP